MNAFFRPFIMAWLHDYGVRVDIRPDGRSIKATADVAGFKRTAVASNPSAVISIVDRWLMALD